MFRTLGRFFPLFVCVACQSQEGAAPPAATPQSASSAPAVASTPEVVPQPETLPKAPPELAVPAGSKLVLKARGKGVQIYACTAKPDDAKAFEWKLKAPEADLFDEQGQKVAHHFAGPTWQATDGSSVVGNMLQKLDAPDPQAIPWLMLAAKETKGPGLFEHVAHVQRLDTNGGKAQPSGCDSAHAAAEQRVPYEATYYFYSAAAN
jgi:hypothetical protein